MKDIKKTFPELISVNVLAEFKAQNSKIDKLLHSLEKAADATDYLQIKVNYMYKLLLDSKVISKEELDYNLNARTRHI